MDDLISRQAAIDIAKDLTITVKGYEMHNQAVMNYCADIMQLLPIQPAEPQIIRCKDCKWWDRYNDYKGYCMAAKSCTYTTHWDIQIRRTYDGDFYCAHAEPKEGEEGKDE